MELKPESYEKADLVMGQTPTEPMLVPLETPPKGVQGKLTELIKSARSLAVWSRRFPHPLALVPALAVVMTPALAPGQALALVDAIKCSASDDAAQKSRKEPLDTKWVIRQVLKDPLGFAFFFVLCWGVSAAVFFLLPVWAQELAPLWLLNLWWIIGGFIFLGIALGFLKGRMLPALVDRQIASQKNYKIGPRGGVYRIDEKGRKRYDYH